MNSPLLRQPGTPGTPGNHSASKRRKFTPCASGLNDGSNVFTLTSFDSTLVSDINRHSFHSNWCECYMKVANNVRSTQPSPRTACLLPPRPQHRPPIVPSQVPGGVEPPIWKHGSYYARRLVVLMVVKIDGCHARLVPMLVDTGAPRTHLAVEALDKLGYDYEAHPSVQHVDIQIAGAKIQAVITKADVHNKLLLGLNILGMDTIETVFGKTVFESMFVAAFNGEGLPGPAHKRPRVEDDQDVLRSFFNSNLSGPKLINMVLSEVEGEDLSAEIYDKARSAIERCKPKSK